MKRSLLFVLILIILSCPRAIADPVTCSGKIWNIWTDKAGVSWLEIGHGIYQCSVKDIASANAKKILSVCSFDTDCSVHVNAKNRSQEELANRDSFEIWDDDQIFWVRKGLSKNGSDSASEKSDGAYIDHDHTKNGIANRQEAFVMLNCYSEGCTYSAIQKEIKIREISNGTLIGATATECETSHHYKPERYTCRKSEGHLTQYVAFCSIQFPSISFFIESDKKWQRIRLSISHDGGFGLYYDGFATQYLFICHDYVRGHESLDVIGAKFGYKARHLDPDQEDNLIGSIDELPD